MKTITNNELDKVLREYPISNEKEKNKILPMKQSPNGDIYYGEWSNDERYRNGRGIVLKNSGTKL